MSVKDPATVNRYAKQHASLVAALVNLTEFVESMPAPDEHGQLQNVDYGYTGSTAHLCELVAEAVRVAESMSK
jgi:hypothetical protein